LGLRHGFADWRLLDEPAAAEEKKVLEQRRSILERSLEAINSRLKALKNETSTETTSE
jgi:hypothetical protein